MALRLNLTANNQIVLDTSDGEVVIVLARQSHKAKLAITAPQSVNILTVPRSINIRRVGREPWPAKEDAQP